MLVFGMAWGVASFAFREPNQACANQVFLPCKGLEPPYAPMSIRGVNQCKSLLLRYHNKAGSSAGVR